MAAITVTVDDEAGTRRLAEDLAMILAPGDVVALAGDLGMGKSAFARALVRALADDERLEVPSPTFTLAQVYELPALTVTHFDLYRLADPDELGEIGFLDACVAGAVLVEWPDRAGPALPADALTVAIAETDRPDGRRFTLSGGGLWPDRLARTTAIRTLVEAPGRPPARRRRMAGDASSRRYERVERGRDRLVVMDWPRRPPQPVLADGLSYPELVHVQDDALAFVGVAAIMRDGGFRVPDIHAVDRAAGLVVMEDLGTAGLVEDERPVPDRFLAAAGILAAKDAAGLPAAVDLPGLGRWDVPVFDRRALLTELSLLPDWYLPLITGAATLPAEREAFLALWSPLIDAIAVLPAGLMLRDVIAANLVWMGGAGTQRVAFLDVQDAMVGPQAYDLMSLVTDVRLDLPASLVAEMQAAYRAVRAAADPGFDADTLEAAIALTAAQRNSKILGGFARLALRDGKRGYLAHLPLARRRVADALSHPVLQPLRLWYERHRLLD